MARIIRFPRINRKGSKAGESSSSLSLDFEKVKKFAKSLNERAYEKVSIWQSLLNIVTDRELRKLQKAFEEAPQLELDDDQHFLSEFLTIRRYLLAAVIYRASHTKKGSKSYEQTAQRIEDNLNTVALQNNWDWVSFNELEFELFSALSVLSRDKNMAIILNKAKQVYLLSTLSLSAKFWNMQEAVRFYNEIWEYVKVHRAEVARDTFLQFFEKNDQKIIYHYRNLNS